MESRPTEEKLIDRLTRYVMLYNIVMLRLDQLLTKEGELIHKKYEDNTESTST